MGRPQRMAAGSASDLTRGFRNQVRAVWSRIVATRGPAVRIWRIRVASRQRRDFLGEELARGYRHHLLVTHHIRSRRIPLAWTARLPRLGGAHLAWCIWVPKPPRRPS
jgi:hypothetical protein